MSGARCASSIVRGSQHDRGTAKRGERGYGRRWQKARWRYLMANPWCVAHQRVGRTVPATDVDHIKPHRGNYALFWDETNWQSLCHECHSRKTASGDRGDGRPAPVLGCDADGRPLDPDHWWNARPAARENLSELALVDRPPPAKES